MRVELCELAKSLHVDDLRTALQVFELELMQRQGQQKYQLPDHVVRLLN